MAAMVTVALVAAVAVFLWGCGGGEETPGAPAAGGPAGAAQPFLAESGQRTCPVMGGAISADYYTDYEGVRVYFCCAECLETFKADPEKYMAKVNQEIAAAAGQIEESAAEETAPSRGRAGRRTGVEP